MGSVPVLLGEVVVTVAPVVVSGGSPLELGAVGVGAGATFVVVTPGDVRDGTAVGAGSVFDAVGPTEVVFSPVGADGLGSTPVGPIAGTELAEVPLDDGDASTAPVEELPQLAVNANKVQVGNALPRRWALAPTRRKYSRTGKVMPRYAAPREIDRSSFRGESRRAGDIASDRAELHDRRDSG